MENMYHIGMSKITQKNINGMLYWNGKDIVNCITNWTETNESVSCFCRSQGFLIQISRFKAIGDYSDNNGRVDIADMRRLDFSSTIMELH